MPRSRPSPSFLDYPVRIQKQHGRNNPIAVRGASDPLGQPDRNLPDPISPCSLCPLIIEIGQLCCGSRPI